MEKFKLSNNINPNRIFILQKSEIEKRLDPYFYLPKFKIIIEKFKTIPNQRLSLISEKIFSGSTPLSGGDAYTDKKNGIAFIRSGDFSIDGSINFDDLVYIKPEIHEKTLLSSQLKENDLLFAIVGATIGKVGVYKNTQKANINQAICAVRLQNGLNTDYVNAFFQTSIGQSLIDRIKRPVARANVNLDEIASLPIIIPDIETQEKVAATFKNSLIQKAKLEIAAEELLASIDDYLLGELGIKMPTENDVEDIVSYQGFELNKQNSLVKNGRLFLTGFREIGGGRFDAKYQQTFFTSTIQAINKSKYSIEHFRHLICDLKNGIEIRNYVEKNGLRYLRVTDLGKNGLNDNSPRFVEAQEIPERIKLNEKCILISRSGSLGLVNVFEPKLSNAILSSHIFKVGLNTEIINPLYLEVYLRSKIGQTEFFRNNNGGVIPEINQEALKSIHIVVPPIEKQKEIALYISEIREKAKCLQVESIKILGTAKQEIEQMILG